MFTDIIQEKENKNTYLHIVTVIKD